MKNAIRLSTCAIAAIALSGCQGFVDKFAFGGKKADRAEATAVFGNDELQNGRAALKAGYPAAAIKQFRMAALNEESAPDAFNGLGVAYAKLGRADLAERYFKMAVSLDGNNPKFAANLDRFYNSALGNSVRALAMREKEAEIQLAAAAAAAQAQGLLDPVAVPDRRGAVTLEDPAVKLTRTSGRELMIATRTSNSNTDGTGRMPVMAIRNPAAAKVEDKEQPAATDNADAEKKQAKGPTRISMLGTVGSTESYPVRIRLTKPNSRGTSQPARRSYPVRIALGQNSSSE